ncbi:hypothetical protein M2440_001750 [Methylorubrum extorquens]|nr:hypothetical protein [Methylorubrum extorquens]MDH6665543.1 hypothetical protein [Methylorubrum zatmanii]
MLGGGQGPVQVEHDEQGHSLLREALIECGDRWSRSLVGKTCGRERSTGSNESVGQFDKGVAENAEYVLKSGRTKLCELFVGYFIEYLFGQLLALSLYLANLFDVRHRTDGSVLIL